MSLTSWNENSLTNVSYDEDILVGKRDFVWDLFGSLKAEFTKEDDMNYELGLCMSIDNIYYDCFAAKFDDINDPGTFSLIDQWTSLEKLPGNEKYT